MKLTKRIASLVLILAFAVTSLCTFTVVSAADFSDVAETNPYYEAITALVDEGIINGYEDGTFKPDNTINRAEFSKLLAVAAAPSGYVFSATTTTFSDIADQSANHGWAIPYIAYAVSIKAVNGYPDGTFQAGNNVTYAEAVKMIVCTLGYGPVVDTNKDPWYQGYIDVANQIGLTKGAIALGDTPAPRGLVAKLIYNMLDCKSLVQTGTDSQGKPVYNTSDKPYIDDTNITESDEGIIMGVTDYSLDNTSVGRDRVQIGEDTYVIGGNLSMDTLKSWLGMRVEFSVKGSGSKQEIVKATRVSKSNSEFEIEPWQIFDISASTIEYYEDEDAEYDDKTSKVNISDAYIVYNGMPVKPSDIDSDFIKDKLDVTTGSIRFLSNDGNDKTAEVIFVESYTTYFANSPVTSNGVTTLYDKNTSITKIPSIAIDEDDVASVTKVSTAGGNATTSSLTSITNKSVVLVAVPYGADAGKSTEGTSVIISSVTASGEVKELDSEYENIKIGSKTYELSPYYKTLMAEKPDDFAFSTGDNGKFYLDHLGRIVFMEKNETSDPYGLLVAYYKGSGIDSDNSLKVMTSSGTYLEYKIKDTVRVDGDSKSSGEAIDYLINKAAKTYAGNDDIIIQPIRYKLSGSTFSSIDTIESFDNGNYTYSKSGYTFKDGSSTMFTLNSSGTNATIVYQVPKEDDITSYDDYKKSGASSLKDGHKYDVYAYEQVGSAAKVVICFLSGNQTTGAEIVAGTPVYMIESINEANNAAGQVVRKVRYRDISKSEDVKEIYSSDKADVIEDLDELNSSGGDLIKFVTEDGVISKIAKVYVDGEIPADAYGSVVVAGHHVKAKGDNKDNYYQAILGTVYEVAEEGNNISIIPAFQGAGFDASKFDRHNIKSGAPCYKFDSTRKDSKFYAASIAEIVPYFDVKDTEPDKASQVLVIMMNEQVVGIYLLGE